MFWWPLFPSVVRVSCGVSVMRVSVLVFVFRAPVISVSVARNSFIDSCFTDSYASASPFGVRFCNVCFSMCIQGSVF